MLSCIGRVPPRHTNNDGCSYDRIMMSAVTKNPAAVSWYSDASWKLVNSRHHSCDKWFRYKTWYMPTYMYLCLQVCSTSGDVKNSTNVQQRIRGSNVPWRTLWHYCLDINQRLSTQHGGGAEWLYVTPPAAAINAPSRPPLVNGKKKCRYGACAYRDNNLRYVRNVCT